MLTEIIENWIGILLYCLRDIFKMKQITKRDKGEGQVKIFPKLIKRKLM